MSGKSKIEWTEVLGPMSSLVAGIAKRHYIQPVSSFISQMMVIFDSWASTIKAWQGFRWRKAMCLNCIFNSRTSALLHSFGWCWNQTDPTSDHSPTITACRSKTIATREINIKRSFQFPRFAFSTGFESSVMAFLILFKREANALCCNFHYSSFRTHERSIA